MLGERGAAVLDEPVSATMTRKVVSCRQSDTVAGIMEVEAIVPASAASGSDAVLLTVGTASSQANVTLSVK